MPPHVSAGGGGARNRARSSSSSSSRRLLHHILFGGLACLLFSRTPLPFAGAYHVDFNGTVVPYAYTSPSAPLQYTLEIVLLKLGVDAGGRIELDVSLRPKGTVAAVVVYSYFQIVDVLQSTSFKHPNYASYGRAEIAGNSSIAFELPVRNRYYVVIYTPSNSGELSYEGRATILNPHPFARRNSASGNDDDDVMTHLAVEDYHMPLSAYLSTALFAALAAWWFWRFRPSRFRRYRVQHMYLPRLVTLAILARLTSSTLASVYYFKYETTGWTSHDIWFAQSLAEVAASSLFLGLLMLTAMGYTVSRVSLTVRERQLLALAFSTLILLAVLLAGCPKSSNDDKCMSFFLGVQVVRFLITFSVILQLHNHIDTVRDACQAQHATTKAGLVQVLAGYRKLQLLEIFRWIILSYLALPVAFLFSSFSLISWVDENWLPTLADSTCTWAVLLSLGWAMSPGPRCMLDGTPAPVSPVEADVLGTTPSAAVPAPAPAATAGRVPERRPSVATRAEPASESVDSGTSIAILQAGAGGDDDDDEEEEWEGEEPEEREGGREEKEEEEEEREVELSGYATPERKAAAAAATDGEDEDEEEVGSGCLKEEGKLKRIRSSPSLKGGGS